LIFLYFERSEYSGILTMVSSQVDHGKVIYMVTLC